MIPYRPEVDEEEDNETFLRRFCICEEDRLARTGEMHTGLNGPRWFRSENVIPLEQARARQRPGGYLGKFRARVLDRTGPATLDAAVRAISYRSEYLPENARRRSI